MRRRLFALIASLALGASAASASDPCPPLPTAPKISATETWTLPKVLKRVPAPRRHVAPPEGRPQSLRITLTRANCRDDCELNSRVELRGEGEGIYRGESPFLLVKGEHRFPVAPGAMACLFEAFRAADFWSLGPAYMVDEPGLEVSTLEVEIGGRRKTVKDRLGVRVGAPAVLARLELAVEAAGAQSFLHGDANTVPLLRAERFDFRSRAGAVLLNTAANLASDELVLAILAEGAPANQKVSVSVFHDNSAGEAAARGGKLDLVRAMVAAGAFTDTPYQLREDALRAAVENVRPSVVEELIKQGADVQASDADGATLLDRLDSETLVVRTSDGPTLHADRIAVIKRLLAAGAPVPRNALFVAKAPEEVRLLRTAGADLEARNPAGETPLLASDSEDVILALLDAGADRNARDADGKSIHDKAARKRSSMPRVLAWLSAHPAKVR